MRRLACVLIALILSFAGSAFAQSSNTPYPTPQYYASAFNLWSLGSNFGNGPNSFVWPGRTVCNSAAQNTNFFVFNTNAPVYIVDANSANNEVVTPSAVTNTAGSCGFTASPSHTHYTYQVKSGTAGLQEALNTLSGLANYPALVILDRNWYAAALNVPSTTPAAIIAAATGTSGVILEDITTAPATYYSWNGTAYTSSTTAAGLPNLKVTSYTGISAPTALSTAAATNGIIATSATGGTITTGAGTFRLAATYVDASGGETLISTDSASTSTIAIGSTTSTNSISVTSPAAATGAVGWRLYMTAASGSAGAEILYSPTCTATSLQSVFPTGTVCAIGSTATITAIVTGTRTVPAIASAYPRTSGSSGVFPPFTAGTTVASTNTATMGVVNFPAGWLNTLGRSFKVCGNGFATTNGTGGTITLAQTLASVPGVTSITPFTAISGSIAASAIQVPINFCVTYSTAATGATGTLETHGYVLYGVAGTAVGTVSNDIIFTVSSTVDLTKQNQLAVTITPTTAGLTAYQLRQLTIEPLN